MYLPRWDISNINSLIKWHPVIKAYLLSSAILDLIGLVRAAITLFKHISLPKGVLYWFNIDNSFLAAGRFSSYSARTSKWCRRTSVRLRVVLFTLASEDLTRLVIVENKCLWTAFIMYICGENSSLAFCLIKK